MPIFQDSNALAVKFFIQKDLPQEVQAELCETITSLGGRIEEKVPRQGYILVQLGTAEEERLRQCWTSTDRPERHFVPYTYVEACKIAGMLLKQIFLENGAPIAMHIHPSIANVNARSALSSRIMHSGGDPHASAQSARVILADPNTDVFQHLIKTYQGVADKYIESYLWVKKCIEKGTVVYTPLVYKNPGGRRPGEERTHFTEQDESNLCGWIAAKIPYKETGGRTGNRLYQQLCDLSGDPEYAWVSRHTWQSWRERYKKNAERLDIIIASIVEQKKPAPGEKGQYGYVRQPEEKPKRTRKKRVKTAEQPTNPDAFPIDANEMAMLPSGASSIQMDPTILRGPEHHYAMPSLQDIASIGGTYSTILTAKSGVPFDRSTVRNGPNEEEMEDAEESSEWAVRVGDAPPPAWAKRKAIDDNETAVSKKARLYRSSTPTSRVASIHIVNDPTTNLHVIDQGIREIARDFRFTVEEVQEYFDRCGEMELTHLRFQKMRQELQAKFRDDPR